jgi:hypothetical protein
VREWASKPILTGTRKPLKGGGSKKVGLVRPTSNPL